MCIRDSPDDCAGNGYCHQGTCHCRPGYRGTNCSELDSCVGGCSGEARGTCLGEAGCDFC